MDSQKAANWSQIIGTVFAAILLGYAVWDHLPNENQSGNSVAWGDTTKGYIPPAIIALILFASAILQAIASRRRHLPSPKTASNTNDHKPKIEILSPFDNDEVGLYEIVRGHVYPPNQQLQAVVLAGDKRWHPQRPVTVTGSTWSVKCQFGSLEKRGSGLYKVIVLLGSELKQAMTYSELPTDIPHSNIISVNRREVTTEHQLMTARAECDKLKKELQTIKDDAEAQQAERTGILIEKNMLEEKLTETQKALKEEVKRANFEANQRADISKLYNESERQLGDLRWLETRMKVQGEHLDAWVRITNVKCVKLQLTETPRIIFFALWVRNGSIFNITFDFDQVAGRLSFKTRLFNDHVRVPSSKLIDVVSPGDAIEIMIEQPLLATEAETVLDAQKSGDLNGIFGLKNLHIPIRTIHTPQSFQSKLLIHSESDH
jgi:hypothetical protein